MSPGRYKTRNDCFVAKVGVMRGRNVHASLLWWLECDTRWQGERISHTAAFVGCSRSAEVKACQRWPKEAGGPGEAGRPVTGSGRGGGLSQLTSFLSLNRWRISHHFWDTGVRIHGLLQFVAFFTWRTHLTKMYYGMKATWQSVMLCNRFYWETLGPAIHIDVTLTSSANRSRIADHKLFHGHDIPRCLLFQQDNAPCKKSKISKKQFKERNKLLTCNHSNHASVGCAGQRCPIERPQQQRTFSGLVQPVQVSNQHKIRLVFIMLVCRISGHIYSKFSLECSWWFILLN